MKISINKNLSYDTNVHRFRDSKGHFCKVKGITYNVKNNRFIKDGKFYSKEKIRATRKPKRERPVSVPIGEFLEDEIIELDRYTRD